MLLISTHLNDSLMICSVTNLCLGFLLDKKVGVNQPKRVENARILIANTQMDTDKIKVCLLFVYICMDAILKSLIS